MRMFRYRLLRGARPAWAVCCSVLAALAAPAAVKGDTPADGAPLAQKALAVLRANCHRCHGEDGASEGGFNVVLNLEKLSRTHVKPKVPADSLLFQRLTADDDRVMPPPDEQPRPTPADIATINCAGSGEALGELTALRPHVVLVQESQGREPLVSLARHLFVRIQVTVSRLKRSR